MGLWLEVFPHLSWTDYLALPARVVRQAMSYLRTRAEVEKAKQELKSG